MAFEKVSYEKKFYKYKGFSKGDVICEGLFYKTSKDNYEKTNYHLLDKKNNCVHVLNSSGHLNYQMKEEVDFGDFIRVTYGGKYTLEKGRFKGSDCHQFVVERDPDLCEKIAPSKLEEPEEEIADEDLKL